MLPMLKGDNAEAADTQAATFVDGRVAHFWDPDKAMGELTMKTLSLHKTAWDVYLVYPPSVTWEGDTPPTPSFYMHQLSPVTYGVDAIQRLDPERLMGEVRQALASGSRGAS